MEEQLIVTPPAGLRSLLLAVLSPFIACLQFGVVIGYSSPAIPQMLSAGILDKATSDWSVAGATMVPVFSGVGLVGCLDGGLCGRLFGILDGWLIISLGSGLDGI